MLAFLPNQLKRSTRSLRGSATTSSRKTEKFRVNPFAKVLLCTTSLLLVIVVLPPAIFAQVDPATVYARAFAVLAAEPYVKQGFHVREDYWPGDLAPGERKAIRQQLFKGNEYWFWLGTEVDPFWLFPRCFGCLKIAKRNSDSFFGCKILCDDHLAFETEWRSQRRVLFDNHKIRKKLLAKRGCAHRARSFHEGIPRRVVR